MDHTKPQVDNLLALTAKGFAADMVDKLGEMMGTTMIRTDAIRFALYSSHVESSKTIIRAGANAKAFHMLRDEGFDNCFGVQAFYCSN